MLKFAENCSDPKPNTDCACPFKIFNPMSPDSPLLQLEINENLPVPQPTHKRQESTSNTQTINDSSLDISPNSSGVMLLEQIAELKKLFEIQGKEIENVGQAINSPNNLPDRMKEIFESIGKDAPDSMMESMNQYSGFNFGGPKELISPVAKDFKGSFFASSLMSLSDYQVKVTEIKDENEGFLSFVKKRFGKLTFRQKLLLKSHIPGISL